MFELAKDILTGKKHIRITDHSEDIPAFESPSQMMDRAMRQHRTRTDAIFSTPIFKK